MNLLLHVGHLFCKASGRRNGHMYYGRRGEERLLITECIFSKAGTLHTFPFKPIPTSAACLKISATSGQHDECALQIRTLRAFSNISCIAPLGTCLVIKLHLGLIFFLRQKQWLEGLLTEQLPYASQLQTVCMYWEFSKCRDGGLGRRWGGAESIPELHNSSE